MRTRRTTTKTKRHGDRKPDPPAPAKGAALPQRASREEELRIAKATYLDASAGMVLARQFEWVLKEQTAQGLLGFLTAIKESVQPRDAIEEMIVLQMTWTHARLAKLTAMANNQSSVQASRFVHDACDRAANTFRRQMQALAEYRRPPQAAGFVAIRQANVANQQVVQNVENQTVASPDFRKPVASNEQGSATPQALPPVGDGAGLAATVRPAQPAVAVEHRAADGAGQGPV